MDWLEFDEHIFQDSIAKGAKPEPFMAAERPEQIAFFNSLQTPIRRSSLPIIRVIR